MKTYTLKSKLGYTVATRSFDDVRDAKLWARCFVASQNEIGLPNSCTNQDYRLTVSK